MYPFKDGLLLLLLLWIVVRPMQETADSALLTVRTLCSVSSSTCISRLVLAPPSRRYNETDDKPFLHKYGNLHYLRYVGACLFAVASEQTGVHRASRVPCLHPLETS